MIYSKCENWNQIRAEKIEPPDCLMEPQAFPKIYDLILYEEYLDLFSCFWFEENRYEVCEETENPLKEEKGMKFTPWRIYSRIY